MSSIAERILPSEAATDRTRAAPDSRLYATPVHAVFLTGAGEIRRTVEPGQPVLPLASLAAPGGKVRALSVAGTSLHTLSATGGGDLASALGLSADYAQALKMAGQAISTVSVIGTAINVALTALEWLGVFGEGDNPFDAYFQAIASQLRDIYNAGLAGQKIDTLQQLAVNLSHARTAAKIVGDYHLAPTPAREAQLPNADYWSQFAVEAIGQEAMWLRTYNPDAAPIPAGGASGWEFGPKVGPDLLTWDWRLPLLSYVPAVAARIAVIRTIDPGIDAVHQAEILGYAKSLKAIEARIRSGFSRSIPAPDAGWNFWEVVTRDSCGVIEVQSGESDVTWSWNPMTWFKDPSDADYYKAHGLPANHQDYLKWHRQGVELRYWRLYDRLGLFALWTMISDVEAAAKGEVAELQKHYDLAGLAGVDGRARLRLENYARWSDDDRPARRIRLDPERPDR